MTRNTRRKLAACDFDGTLFRGGAVAAGDLAAIARWRSAGNLFGIVTGRGHASLLCEVRRFAVPCDFMICNNGALICDAHARRLFCAALPEAVRASILAHDGLRACGQCAFFAGEAMYAHARKPPAWLLRNYALCSLSSREAVWLPLLHQISLAYDSPEAVWRWAEAFAGVVGDGAHCSRACLDLTAPGVNKATGVERLLRICRWEDVAVLAIGDDRNDLPMIRRFEGYALSDADARLRAEARGVTPDVGALLAAHL